MNKLVALVQAMQSGSISYLEGAVALLALRDSLGIYANDPDFLPFTAVTAELHQLNVNYSEKNWLVAAKKKFPQAMSDAESWAQEIGAQPCANLLRRYKKGTC